MWAPHLWLLVSASPGPIDSLWALNRGCFTAGFRNAQSLDKGSECFVYGDPGMIPCFSPVGTDPIIF